MRPYGLRPSMRCPKKYGEGTKERPDMLGITCDLWPEKSGGYFPKPQPDRFRRNAAVLPELDQAASAETSLTAQERVTICGPMPCQSAPLMIHGYTVPEYQQTYHSVVDPLLNTPCGERKAYSPELGRTIKEHLFAELCYPVLQITEQKGEKLEIVERFCVLRSTPHIEVDMNGEPP